MIKIKGSAKKILLILFCAFFAPCFVCQASLIFVSPQPTKIRLNVAAGKSASGEISITNPANSEAVMRIYIQDFIIDEKGHLKYLPKASQPNSCAKWLEINPESLTLQPKAKAKIAYTLRPPLDAKGTYYAVIFFENYGDKKTIQQGVAINITARIGSYITAMIEGTTKRSYSEANVEVAAPGENKPLAITYSLKNLGNVDIEVKGDYNILDEKGNFFGRGKYRRGRAMPGGAIKKSEEYLGNLAPGKYSLVSTFNIGPDQPLDTVVKETEFTVK